MIAYFLVMNNKRCIKFYLHHSASYTNRKLHALLVCMCMYMHALIHVWMCTFVHMSGGPPMMHAYRYLFIHNYVHAFSHTSTYQSFLYTGK